MTEVANQAILNPQKLRAFTDYIETLVTFFPNISMELKHFLLSLQEWLRSMRFKALTMSAYKSKVLRALGDLTRAYHRHTGGGADCSVPALGGHPGPVEAGRVRGQQPRAEGLPLLPLDTLPHPAGLLAGQGDTLHHNHDTCHVPRAGPSLEPGRHEHRGQGHGRIHQPPLQLSRLRRQFPGENIFTSQKIFFPRGARTT